MTAFICLLVALAASAESLVPGNYTRTVQADGRERSYLVHIPKKYDATHSTPIVLVLHGAWTNGPITAIYTGLNGTADDNNFIAVYPNGTGLGNTALFWNCDTRNRHPIADRTPPDDVAFIGKVLDDLGGVANVDPKRIYATGISNGGMMCHRLAAEMSDRIAAIAPISGTLCLDDIHPKRPVPVLNFHGTADKLVLYDGSKSAARELLNCKSVDETVRTWVKLDGCPDKPKVEDLPHKEGDPTSVKRYSYAPGKDGSEVILIQITGGGHNWPGRPMLPGIDGLLGPVSHDVSANDMIWEFFQKHPLK